MYCNEVKSDEKGGNEPVETQHEQYLHTNDKEPYQYSEKALPDNRFSLRISCVRAGK